MRKFNGGNVLKSDDVMPHASRFHALHKTGQPSDCWEWLASKLPRGYGTFSIGGKKFRAHRVAYALSKGSIPSRIEVMHSCDNPRCVNPNHLSLGTRQQNNEDRILKGRSYRWNGRRVGVANPDAKLTEEQVLAIRVSVLPAAKIADQFGISKSSIWNIKHRKTWAHLQ